MCAYAIVCTVNYTPRLYRCCKCDSVEVEFCAGVIDKTQRHIDIPYCARHACPLGKKVEEKLLLCHECDRYDGRGAKHRVHIRSEGSSYIGNLWGTVWDRPKRKD